MSQLEVRLNHVILYTSNLARGIEFYELALGMTVAVRSASMAFLRAKGSPMNHDLGLVELGDNPQLTKVGGVIHVAWQVDSLLALVIARQNLEMLGCLSGEANHGCSKSIYGKDPDSNWFEITWMLPAEEWGVYDHETLVEPLDWNHELSSRGIEDGPAIAQSLKPINVR